MGVHSANKGACDHFRQQNVNMAEEHLVLLRHLRSLFTAWEHSPMHQWITCMCAWCYWAVPFTGWCSCWPGRRGEFCSRGAAILSSSYSCYQGWVQHILRWYRVVCSFPFLATHPTFCSLQYEKAGKALLLIFSSTLQNAVIVLGQGTRSARLQWNSHVDIVMHL